MTTIKEARIEIFSVIENLDGAGLPDGDAEKNESRATGFLHVFDDAVLITYTETNDGSTVTSEIKCAGGEVRVIRRGAIVSDMCFAEGVVHSSVYTVSPYSFDAEVKAKKVRYDISADGGRLDILYGMKIGGAEKKCRMTIKVEAV